MITSVNIYMKTANKGTKNSRLLESRQTKPIADLSVLQCSLAVDVDKSVEVELGGALTDAW